MSTKNDINLLQAELYPEKDVLTLTKVVSIWLVLLLCMLVWGFITEYNYSKSNVSYSSLSNENKEKKAAFKELESKVKNRKISPSLKSELETLKFVIQHKQALLGRLTDSNETFAGGFVMAMNDLSAMHHKGIRLKTINIDLENMTFTGLATTPQAVPAWLAGFKKSRLLSGKEFSQFKLAINEEGITQFIVSSVPKGDKG